MAKKVTFDEADRIVEIETTFCEFCDKEFRSKESTADHPEMYCSQACEASDNIEESDEDSDNLDLENGKR